MKSTKMALAGLAAMLAGTSAYAQTEIELWHAFSGRLADLVAEQVDTYKA